MRLEVCKLYVLYLKNKCNYKMENKKDLCTLNQGLFVVSLEVLEYGQCSVVRG